MAKERRLKHKWTLDEFLDSIRDHLGHIIDNVGIRDIVYVACWISGTVLIYNSVVGIKKILLKPPKALLEGGWINIMGAKGIYIPEPSPLAQEYAASLDEIDWNIFMLSMIGAYGLLKIDVGDVTNAIGKLQSAITAAATKI